MDSSLHIHVTSYVVSGTEKIWVLYKQLLHNLGQGAQGQL